MTTKTKYSTATTIILLFFAIVLLKSFAHAAAGEVHFKRSIKGSLSGIKNKEYVLVRDQNAFEKLWSRYFSIREPVPQVPPINFNNKIVIAVFRGDQISGGYAIEITKIEVKKGVLIANLLVFNHSHSWIVL